MSKTSRKWLRRSGLALAGVVMGLLSTEGMFWWRDDGAFPHLNLYEPDPDLGARLRPNASTRLRVADNPVTTVRTNRQGYRGADWPAPGGREVLVVGDSQVLGLGVEEGETFSAQLDELLGEDVRVLNAGVPTYGPAEYRAVIKEVGRERKPEHVVLVFNMVNDLQEARRPNRERHAIWDGWAVRRETAPEQAADFPGKSWLFNRSHAVFALRKFLAERDAATRSVVENPLPSEGAFTDLVAASSESGAAHAVAREETEKNRATFLRQMQELEGRAKTLDDQAIADLVELQGFQVTPVVQITPVTGSGYVEHGVIYTETVLRAARANPGDIVGDVSYAESTGPYAATARVIRQGAALRHFLESTARKRFELVRDEKSRAALASVEAVRAIDRKLEKLLAQTPERAAAWSPLKEEIEKARALCDEWGAQLTVVVLPFDVQVSQTEWEKYGGEPVDMRSTLILNEDAAHAARAVRARVVDPLEALRAAEPGAFLRGDLHLTARGHRVVAEEIAAALQGPPPLPRPTGGLPSGRSRVPQPEALLVETVVAGSTAAHCETYLRGHWFRGICGAHEDDEPVSVRLSGDHAGEMVTYRLGDELSFLVPFAPGSILEGYVSWQTHRRALRLAWNEDEPALSLGEAEPLGDEPASPTAPLELTQDGATCTCARKEFEKRASARGPIQADNARDVDLKNDCIHQVLSPEAGCEAAYEGDCEKLLACENGDPWFPPACPEGSAPGGALERCLPLCDPKERPCESGVCQPWQGAHLCFPGPSAR